MIPAVAFFLSLAYTSELYAPIAWPVVNNCQKTRPFGVKKGSQGLTAGVYLTAWWMDGGAEGEMDGCRIGWMVRLTNWIYKDQYSDK